VVHKVRYKLEAQVVVGRDGGVETRGGMIKRAKCQVDAWADMGQKRGRSDREPHTQQFSTRVRALGEEKK